MTEIDRRKLTRVAGLLKSVTPFVAGDFLKLLPLRRIRAVGKPMQINYSPPGYDDALPAEVMKVFREAATVKSMTKADGGFRLEADLHPGRAININFGDST